MFAYMTQDLYSVEDLEFGSSSISGWVNPQWSTRPEYTYAEPKDAGPIASVFDETNGAYDPESDGTIEEWKKSILDEWLGSWSATDGSDDLSGDTFYGNDSYYVHVNLHGDHSASRAIHFVEELFS